LAGSKLGRQRWRRFTSNRQISTLSLGLIGIFLGLARLFSIVRIGFQRAGRRPDRPAATFCSRLAKRNEP
jgi:hypothetical protein